MNGAAARLRNAGEPCRGRVGTDVFQVAFPPLPVVVTGLFLAVLSSHAAQAEPACAGPVGVIVCRADAGSDWVGSDHAKAWTLHDESMALGDLSDIRFEHCCHPARFQGGNGP
jgi:hypothetical protein